MEIATAVGGALLGPLFQSLINQLSSQELLHFVREKDVLSELTKWKPKLEGIYGVLEDAEQTTNRSVKIWVSQLRHLAYDVEDILDEFDYEVRLSKLKGETSRARKIFGNMNLKKAKFNKEMISKVKGISTRLEEITTTKNQLQLREVGVSVGNICRGGERETTCLVNTAEIYGREEDKKAILQLLNSESSSGRAMTVIGIVGMGGVGKTTLAQLIFDEAKKKFNVSAWISVGEEFNIRRLTKSLLQSVGGTCNDSDDLNQLQVSLKEKLSGKKFLIVLDDVWTEKYEDWTLFRRPLENGAVMSKIIVTTRSHSISQKMDGGQGYTLHGLTSDESLRVLAQHAFGKPNFQGFEHLADIGKKIVKRCRGLPLAVKALGGLLKGQQTPTAWEDVRKSGIWEENSSILPALRLSYYYLPPHLKRCFSYCAIFPKDYEFNDKELIKLWEAEGFLQLPSVSSPNRMQLGYTYFLDLLSRSFFQKSTYNRSRYVMHDLMNDLSHSINEETCLNWDDKSMDPTSHAKVRHLAFTAQEFDIYQRFEGLDKMSNLRTFLALSFYPNQYYYRANNYYYIANNVVQELVPKLKRLRVLSLVKYRLDELPSSIGALKHLRHLDLSYTKIVRLPQSFGNLVHLEALNLCGCADLVELPSDIDNLINLMHLDLEGTSKLKEMPPVIANLTNLQTLSKFIVGKSNIKGLGIRDLMNFACLAGKLCIEGLENVSSNGDANVVDLNQFEGLDELDLGWSDSPREKGHEFQVLNSLKPHKNLKKLFVKFYGGERFPSWIGDSTFTNMIDIRLCNCPNITSLPAFGGLPKLKNLCITGMRKVVEVGVEFYGENFFFPSLKTLEIEDMPVWKQWSHPVCLNEGVAARIFPRLHKLTISSCPELVGTLPTSLSSLEELRIKRCQHIILKSVPHLSSLKTLLLDDISELENLDEVVTESMVKLKSLKIENCEQLKFLWQAATNLDKLSSLNSLHIKKCLKLVSVVGGEEELLPRNLQILEIEECDELENLPHGLHNLTSLHMLKISYCQKLVSFPAAGLPCSLESLEITNCRSLESLPKGIMVDDTGRNEMSHLESLSVIDCASLTSIPTGVFPSSLRSLQFCCWSTQLLGSLGNNRFSHLIGLRIHDCKLECFPESGLVLPNLSSLEIENCQNLRRLPNQMHNLTSLQNLSIFGCRGLVSFPDEGLPPNLSRLQIFWCENLQQPVSEWKLNRLTSRTIIGKGGKCESTKMGSFPDKEGLWLPSSLTFLNIGGFENLKSISSGINCLTSLQRLWIQHCPKLEFFPREGLPPTLGRLSIFRCPLLEKRCREKEGEYWRFIANIPDVRFK